MEDSILEYLSQHYSLNGHLKALDSYIDKNYLLTTKEHQKYVVKLANPATKLDKIILENSAMQHLAEQSLHIKTPKVICNKSGNGYSFFEHADTQWTLRVLTWLEGDLYHQITAPSKKTHHSLGLLVAQMTNGLANFKSAKANRAFKWDIAQLEMVASDLKYYQSDKRELLEKQLEHFTNYTKPNLEPLPKQVIHNDCNDYNIVMTENDGSIVCCGVFDFGDLVYTQRVCDLAVALTYALFNQKDILQTARRIVESYLSLVKLTEQELKILLDLVQARLTQSLLNSAESYYKDPTNDYILVSQKPAWELLTKLNQLSAKDRQDFYNKIIQNSISI